MKRLITLLILLAHIPCRAQTSIEYSTGTMNVNIPIYNLRGYNIDIPVSLSYSATGIKVNDVSSNIGLGWNLNAGGCISREVHGLPDEDRTSYTSSPEGGGYLKANDYMVEQDFVGQYFPGMPTESGGLPPMTIHNAPPPLSESQKILMLQGKLDLEPDIFHVNAPGLSVKFMFGVDDRRVPAEMHPNYYNLLDHDPDPISCFPPQDIKITYTREENRITSFQVINLDGIIYKFDQMQFNTTSMKDATFDDSSIPDSELPEAAGPEYVTAWYLSEIINPNGQTEANFTYNVNEEYSSIGYYDATLNHTVSGSVTFAGEMDNDPQPFNGVGICMVPDKRLSQTFIKSSMKYVRIAQISALSGTIEFVYGDERLDLENDMELNEIIYTNGDGYFMGRQVFNQEYSTSANSTVGYESLAEPQDEKHLILKSILSYGSDNLPIDGLTYLTYSNPNALPMRNSYAQDHWGYQGFGGNDGLVCNYDMTKPYSALTYRESYVNREATTAQYGILEKIKWPSGGYEQFEYENHDYSRIGQNDIDPFQEVTSYHVEMTEVSIEVNCYDPEQILETMTEFVVPFEQDVRVDYHYSQVDGPLAGDDVDCTLDDNESHLFKHVIIRSPNSVQFDRTVPSEKSEDWTNSEWVHLTPGTWQLVTRIIVKGKNSDDVSLDAIVQIFDSPAANAPWIAKLQGGGKRIKRIITSDGDDDHTNDMITRLEYAHNDDAYGASFGVLLSKPLYKRTVQNQQINQTLYTTNTAVLNNLNTNGSTAVDCDCVYEFLTTGSISPLLNERGSFVLYSNVRVYNEYDTDENGYTEYVYHVNDIPPAEDLISGLNLTTGWRNTALQLVKSFKKMEDGSFALINEVEYNYEITPMTPVWGCQLHTTNTTGVDTYIASGIPHAALVKAQLKALGQTMSATVSYALASGPVAPYTAAFSLLMSAGTLLYLVLLDINNDEPIIELAVSAAESITQQENYKYTNELFQLKEIVTKEYDEYDPTRYITSTETIDAVKSFSLPSDYSTIRGIVNPYRKVRHIVKYSQDYSLDGGNCNGMMNAALQNMRYRFMKSVPIETLDIVVNEDNQDMVIAGNLQTYKLVDGMILPYQSYRLELGAPIPFSSFIMSESCQNGGGTEQGFWFDKRYRLIQTNDEYDDAGRVITMHNTHDVQVGVLSDFADNKPVAQVLNAASTEVAYSSFESENTGGFGYSLSGLHTATISHNGMDLPEAKTGISCYNLNLNPITVHLGEGGQRISYWSKLGEPDWHYSAALEGLVLFEEVVTGDQDSLNWNYHEWIIMNNSDAEADISLYMPENADCFLDELRCYPKDALLTTIAYYPTGEIHTTCDENNNCVYMGYDNAGRPKWIMDNEYNLRATTTEIPKCNLNGDEFDFKRKVSRVMLEQNTDYIDAFEADFNDYSVITTQYFVDGLGRTVQTQGYKQSSGNKDIVSGQFFNQFGRIEKRYLPYTKNYPGECFIDDFIDEQAMFYQYQPDIAHNGTPYSEIKIENASRGRVIEQGNVGDKWQLGMHTMRQQFGFNDANEVLFFKTDYSLQANETPWYSCSAMENGSPDYWPANSLVKIVIQDENNIEIVQFIDPFGRLILKRQFVSGFQNGNDFFTSDLTLGKMGDNAVEPGTPVVKAVDTYYVYNLKGEMKFEISPEFLHYMELTQTYAFTEEPDLPTSELYFRLGYGNRFDLRGNLVEKHTPETRNKFFVYDDCNKLTLSQDAEQRTTAKWSFVKYDVFGRSIYNGTLTYDAERELLQNLYYLEAGSTAEENENFICFEYRTDDPAVSSNGFGYSFVNGPPELLAFDEIFKVAYFDDYTFDIADFEFQGTASLSKRIKGAPTGSLTKILDQPSDTYLLSVVYYDGKNLPIEAYSRTLLGGYDKQEFSYNWQGKLIHSKRTLLAEPSLEAITVENTYEYDRMGRMLNYYQKTGENDPMVQLFGLQYNEIGQVIRKHLHLPEGMNTGMQVIDYRYNERGWLRKINNSNLVDDGDNLEDNDVFGMELFYYNQNIIEGGNKFNPNVLAPQDFFSGQLSAITYNTKNPDDDGTTVQEKSYVYRYDDMNRMTCAAFGVESMDFATYGLFVKNVNSYMEKVDYNLSGNMLHLSRFRPKMKWLEGSTQQLDILSYSYYGASHRLRKVEDAGEVQDYPEFTHFLDLADSPEEYQYDRLGNCIEDKNKMLSYTYNAIGLMSSATHDDHPEDPCIFTYDAHGNKLAKSVGGHTTYYIAGVEFAFDGVAYKLQNISNPVGSSRVNMGSTNSTEFLYDYYLTDHLGNVRAVITEENAAPQQITATMEQVNSGIESEYFDFLSYSRSAVSLGYPATQETGENVSELGQNTTQGPANLTAVHMSDQLQVTVQSWYEAPSLPESGVTLAGILADLVSNLLVQGSGIMPPGEDGLGAFNEPLSAQQSSLSNFLNTGFNGEDLGYPQGYLVYIFFDESLVVNTSYSGVIQVSEPGLLEELQTMQLTMPANGYFFTYLTNYSDQMVAFDNLTIHYVQGVLRAQYDYYPYGLSWGQTESAYNKTYSATEFNYNEWSTQGLDLQHFEARMYDAVLGRWHAPDPLEQFHSPYLAMCDNPANFIDPDGRAGIPWLQDFMESDLGMFCQWGASLAAMVGGVALLDNISVIGGTVKNVVSCTASFGVMYANAKMVVKDVLGIASKATSNIESNCGWKQANYVLEDNSSRLQNNTSSDKENSGNQEIQEQPGNWFHASDNTIQFSTTIYDETDILPSEQFLGATHRSGTTLFRSDGSIFFKEEAAAYSYMWENSIRNQRETFSVITTNGVLFMPEYLNDIYQEGSQVISSDPGMSFGYSYSSRDGQLYLIKNDEVHLVLGAIHTHPFKLSEYDYDAGLSGRDTGFSEMILDGRPIIAIGWDNRTYLYGKYLGKFQYMNMEGYSRDKIMNGQKSFIPTLKKWKQ